MVPQPERLKCFLEGMACKSMKKFAKTLSVFLVSCVAVGQCLGAGLGASAASGTPITLAFPDFGNAAQNSLLTLSGRSAGAAAAIVGSTLSITPNNVNAPVVGDAFLANKIKLGADRSFSTFFTCTVSPGSMYADGFAFVIANSQNAYDDHWTNMGIPNGSINVAVEFDTYTNGGDVSDNHFGIDVNGDTGSVAQKDLNNTNSSLKDNKQKYVWVTYDGSSKVMTAIISETANPADGQTLTWSKDLSIILPSSDVYLGFVGGHFGSNEQNVIQSWYVNNTSAQLDASALAGYSQPAASVSVSASPASGVTSTAAVTVATKNADGSAAANVPVTLSTDRGMLSQSSVTTDANGQATVTLTNKGVAPGNAIVRAVTAQGILGTGKIACLATDYGRKMPLAFQFADFSTADVQSQMLLSGNNGDYAARFVGGELALTPNPGASPGKGWGFYKNALTLGTDYSFSTWFKFRITEGRDRADGFAFVLSDTGNSYPSSGETNYFGMPKDTQGIHSIEVEFDTHQNPESQAQDPNGNHIGFDVNGSGVSVKTIAPDTSSFNLADGKEKYCWVEYDGAAKVIYVTVGNQNDRSQGLTMSIPYDLGTVFSTHALYTGFCGDIYGNGEEHNILAWNFAPAYQPIDTARYSYSAAPTTLATQLNGDNSLTVTINNPYSNYQYQLWSYSGLGSDFPGISGSDQYQWVLRKTLDSSGYSVTIPNATVDQNNKYRLMLLTLDGSGNVVGTCYDGVAIDPASTGAAKINRVLVNGMATDGRETASADSDKSVRIKVDAVNVTGGYTLTYGKDGQAVSGWPIDATGNATVDFTTFAPGTYRFQVKADGPNNTSDEKDVIFVVYSSAAVDPAGYPVIGDMHGGFTGSSLNMTLLNTNTGANFRYNYYFGEPGRGSAGSVLSQTDTAKNVDVGAGKYGMYQASAYAYRNGSSASDDGVIRYYEYKRAGGVSINSVTVNGVEGEKVNSITGTAGTVFNITASAVGAMRSGETMKYSFWRSDARGWVLLKGWSDDATLSWQPAYAGKNYVIQVRAMGSQAGSYEAAWEIQANITSASGLITAKGQLNLATMQNIKARTPVILNANVTNGDASDQLLYRFLLIDSNLGRSTLQEYSPDATCTWTPRKAGEYTIAVMVINQNSFGVYDLYTEQRVTAG